MKISKERKEAAISYIIQKISDGTPGVAAYAAENLGINKSTVHRYINELLSSGEIVKSGHDNYTLVAKKRTFYFDRDSGDFDSDWNSYNRYLRPFVEGFPDNVVKIWEYVFSEMANNVIDHSGADEVRLDIDQNVMNTTVTLHDDGIGIFENIRSYFSFPSLDDAVSELFKGKLTTDEKRHSGEGIFFSSRMMDIFCIISDGKIFTCNKFDESRMIDTQFLKTKGTTVFMRLSNNSKKRAFEVFDAYADVEGGFTKTMIPIKSVFESAPVSRSQAKRLCNRLDRFREVKLDFDSVEWMGQGFAHQIFSVFAGQNPEILLKPVNMNENVTKMYHHVSGKSGD